MALTHESYTQLVAASPDGVVALDGDGRVALVNAAAAGLLGVSEAEALGMLWWQLCPGIQKPPAHHMGQRWWTYLKGCNIGVDWVTLSGGELSELIVLRAAPSNLDSQDRAELDSQDRAESRALHGMISMMIHDFTRLAGSLHRLTDLLRCEVLSLTAEEQAMVFASIRRTANDLLSARHQYTLLFSIELGVLEDIPRRLDLSEVVGRAAERCAQLYPERQMLHEVDLPHEARAITTNEHMLGALLEQLLENAWRYSRPRSVVRVWAEAAGRDVALSVWNPGGPFTEEERQQMFRSPLRAYRGDVGGLPARTTYGLLIVARLAGLLGGRAEYDHDGEGHLFRVVLPR